MITSGIVKRARTGSSLATRPFIVSLDFGNGQRTGGDVPHGFKFTVGNSPITVTELGRWKVSGDTLTHLVALWTNGTTTIASGTVVTSGKPSGTFNYVSITPVVLSANTAYYITCEEAGGDLWYDNAPTTTTSDAVCNTGTYLISGVFNEAGPGQAYGPVNFRYK